MREAIPSEPGRETGTGDELSAGLSGLSPGSRLAALCRNPGDRSAVIEAFVTGGLENREGVVCLFEPPAPGASAAAFPGQRFGEALASGQLIPAAPARLFGKCSGIRSETVTRYLDRAARQATAKGWAGLRVCLDMDWLARLAGTAPATRDLEEGVNRFLAARPAIALSLYARDLLPPERLLEIVRDHPFVIFGREIHENIFHEPRENLPAGEKARRKIESLEKKLRFLRARERSRLAEKEESDRHLRMAEESRRSLLSILEDVQEAENSLAENAAHFRNLADSGRVLVWTQDTGGRADYFNRPWLEFRGRGIGDELGLGWTDGVHPGDLEQYWSLYTGAFEKKSVFTTVFRLRRHDGIYRWMHGDASPRMDSRGEFSGYIVHAFDITERRKAEIHRQLTLSVVTCLNETEDLEEALGKALGLVLEATGADAGAIRLQDGGDFPFFVQAGLSDDFRKAETRLIDGRADPDQAGPELGGACGMIISGKDRIGDLLFSPGGSAWSGDPAGRPPREEDDCPCRERPRRCRDEGFLSRTLVPVRSGRETVGLLLLWGRKSNLFDAISIESLEVLAGQLGESIRRRKAQEELGESFSLLEATMNSTADGILAVDNRGRILNFNRRFLEMWRIDPSLAVPGRDELLLEHVRASLKDPEKFTSRVEELYRHPEETSLDLLEFKDGRVFERYSSPQVLDGRVIGRIWDFRDITARVRDEKEKKALQEQFFRAEKLAAIGELVAGVAHEINNPLTGLIGISSLLLSDGRERFDPETFRDLEVIHGSAERIRKIVGNLLRFSRHDKPYKRPVSISGILDSVIEIRAYEIRARGIELVVEHAESIPEVTADQSQLESVFLNLISNAEHAIRENGETGTLTVRTSLETRGEGREMVSISFRDTGKGIPGEVMQKIFDPFFTTKPVGQGTGLGLSMSYGVIREHGGTILALPFDS